MEEVSNRREKEDIEFADMLAGPTIDERKVFSLPVATNSSN